MVPAHIGTYYRVGTRRKSRTNLFYRLIKIVEEFELQIAIKLKEERKK